jgi:hypothetical protein
VNGGGERTQPLAVGARHDRLDVGELLHGGADGDPVDRDRVGHAVYRVGRDLNLTSAHGRHRGFGEVVGVDIPDDTGGVEIGTCAHRRTLERDTLGAIIRSFTG